MSGPANFSTPTRFRKALDGFRTWYRNILAGLTSDGEFMEADADAVSRQSDAMLLTHPEASLRLTVTMRRLGLVRDNIHDRRMLREIESNCASCDETSDCRHWLQSKKTTGYHRFCLNAWRFDRLLAESGRTVSR